MTAPVRDFTILQAASGPQVAAARELFVEYQASLGVDLCFQGFQAELAGLPGDYVPPRGRLLLALDGEAYAGCVALHGLDDERCEMKRLYVRPRYQGSGLGRRLVTTLLADALAIGYRTVVLDTLPQMQAAQRLYESLGFVDSEPHRPNPVPGARFLALDLQSR